MDGRNPSGSTGSVDPASPPPHHAFRGLTLREPWLWAILHASKPVENRPMRLPAKFVGQWVALHAGLVYDEDAAKWIRETFRLEVPGPDELLLGAVAGLVRFGPPEQLDDMYRLPRNKWESGPWCWPVQETIVLPRRLRCRGMNGFWPVPQALADQLREQLRGRS